MDRLPEALLAVLSIALTALITVFKDDILLLLTGKSSANKDLEGRWACTWHVQAMADGKEPATIVNDVVKIERVSGDRVKATGENATAGTYRLAGKMFRSPILTFSWSGDGERQFLGGVAILHLDITRTEMNGYWYEVRKEGRFIGGQVHWKKQSASQ